MFIGHFAVGFASKRLAPRSSLAILIAAPVFLDMLWPLFVLMGWERMRIDPGNTRFTPFDFAYYPWSHSLVLSIAWATSFAVIYHLAARYWPGTVAVWVGVVSHWVLDWITHRADMPLYPGSARYGLGLWNSIPGTLTVELLLFALGVGIYAATTRAQDRIGLFGFIAYVTLLLVVYIGERFSSPPASVAEIVWPGLAAELILIPWASWFDHHRALRSESGPRE